MISNTQNSQVIKEYYYIIYFRKLLNPELLPIYFVNKNIALDSIQKNITKTNQKYYKVVRGAKVHSLLMRFNKKLGVNYKVLKYDYPDHVVNLKYYRYNMRRRLRRMGMYTKVIPHRFFDSIPQIIKVIKSTQKRTNTPNTIALAFQLQRKPKRYYYIIRKREINKKAGKIFTIHGYRLDIKEKEIKRIKIDIIRKDVITPFLLSEIHYLIKDDEELNKFWQRKKYPIYSRNQRESKDGVPILIQ